MVVLAPGGPPMSRRVYLSHLDMPKGDFRYWHIASFRCAAEFGRYRGIADSDKPSTTVTGRHGRRFFCQILKSFWARAGWRSTVPPSWEAGRSAPGPGLGAPRAA